MPTTKPKDNRSNSPELYPEWRSEQAGEAIEGTVFDIVAREGNWGLYPAVLLEKVTEHVLVEDPDDPTAPPTEKTNELTPNVIMVVHCAPTTLKNQLNKLKPKAGTRLKFIYLGKEIAKSGKFEGKPYFNYKTIDLDAVPQTWEFSDDEDDRPMSRESKSQPDF